MENRPVLDRRKVLFLRGHWSDIENSGVSREGEATFVPLIDRCPRSPCPCVNATALRNGLVEVTPLPVAMTLATFARDVSECNSWSVCITQIGYQRSYGIRNFPKCGADIYGASGRSLVDAGAGTLPYIFSTNG